MNGKELNGLENFRDRMMFKYNIHQNISNEKLVIRIIDSRRYSSEEKSILLNINDILNSQGYDSKYISWANFSSFKEQLEVMNKTDIHIAGPGTSMLNFPFLRDNKVHINLGANPIVGCNIPGLMEINIMLLSNKIINDYYNIMEYKNIFHDKLLKQIFDHINNLKSRIVVETTIPKYVKIWQEYCKNEDESKIDTIIKKMNGLIIPHYMTYRWVECLMYGDGPFGDKNIINFTLLNEIKIKTF